MKIVEKFIKGKNKKHCEDGYIVTDGYIAVIDGATSSGGCIYNGKTSGEYAKDIIIDTISNIPCDVTSHTFFEILHTALKSHIPTSTDIRVADALRASIVVYSICHKEIWSLGDCKFSVNGSEYLYSRKKIDDCISIVRSILINTFLQEGYTVEDLQRDDLSRRMIQPIIDRQGYLENKSGEFGYGVLNGRSLNIDMIKQFPVSSNDIIVFATDGYPVLCNNLSDSEDRLKLILGEDPLLYKTYRSTKGLRLGAESFDDRCYVKFIS